eukprot:gene15956-biopygen18753
MTASSGQTASRQRMLRGAGVARAMPKFSALIGPWTAGTGTFCALVVMVVGNYHDT